METMESDMPEAPTAKRSSAAGSWNSTGATGAAGSSGTWLEDSAAAATTSAHHAWLNACLFYDGVQSCASRALAARIGPHSCEAPAPQAGRRPPQP